MEEINKELLCLRGIDFDANHMGRIAAIILELHVWITSDMQMTLFFSVVSSNELRRLIQELNKETHRSKVIDKKKKEKDLKHHVSREE